MKKIIRRSLSLFVLVVLTACNLGAAPDNAITGDLPALSVTVQRADGVSTFRTVGEVIQYNYVVTNRGSAPIAGPVGVADGTRLVSCPDLATIGNQDANLDPGESLTCTAPYTVTQADVDAGFVTNVAVAQAGGQSSSTTTFSLSMDVAAQTFTTLTLTKQASPQTYNQVGQAITYTYTLTNIGTTPLGPAQFMVSDNKVPTPVNCGPAGTTLAPGQPVSCTASYLITQADMAAPNVTNIARATGANQTSAEARASITNSLLAATQTLAANQTATTAPDPSLVAGSTIQHQVAVGEWLIQIGRCYGASFKDIRDANPQIANPNLILPAMIVVVPRIGSAGTIWGKPCVVFHTVQSGDTWESIARTYNADVTVLRKANPVTLTAGIQVKVPRNSAGTGVPAPLPATPTATATATTTATATATPTATGTAVGPQRISIPAGQTTASLSGAVNLNQTAQYVIAAAQGQTLNITVTPTATTNEIGLGVNGPANVTLKPMDATLVYNTTIAASGDYFINVAGIAGTAIKGYTLMVSLTSAVPPATATATATGTLTNPGSP